MTPDLTFVTETFRKFNLLIFSTGLPLPKICLTHARTFRGKLVYRRRISPLGSTTSDFELRISADYDAPEEDWEDVVIHEMIHLYIAFNGIKDSSSHGPVFRKMMVPELKHTRLSDGRHSEASVAEFYDAEKVPAYPFVGILLLLCGACRHSYVAPVFEIDVIHHLPEHRAV